jgi:outer membrane protein assembly factor BamD
LREVQEVLADRQYRIAHFYYLRDNMAAAQARLQSLIDSYPLYSLVDEALFELGSLYEKEGANMKRQNVADPAVKERMVAQFQKHAIDAYSQIIKRYPAMSRANDARKRLEALNAPVPIPTAEALAESKAEEQSRTTLHMTDQVLGNFRKHPNVARASRVGEPNLNDETQVSAVAMVQDLTNQLNNAAAPRANTDLGITAVGSGSGAAPGPNQPAPGEAAPATGTTQPGTANPAAQPAEGAPPTEAPPQVNEIQKAGTTGAATQANTGAQQNSSTQQSSSDSKQDSSSKKKSKKGLRKLIPF